MMNLQGFVNSLSDDAFKELMEACFQRCGRVNERTTESDEARRNEGRNSAVDDWLSAIIAVKDRIGSGIVDAKQCIEYVNEEIKKRMVKK
jgi:hypothetical protein